jgi:hypothetical protein
LLDNLIQLAFEVNIYWTSKKFEIKL